MKFVNKSQSDVLDMPKGRKSAENILISSQWAWNIAVYYWYLVALWVD